MLSLLGAWVQYPVGELRAHKPHSIAKRGGKKSRKPFFFPCAPNSLHLLLIFIYNVQQCCLLIMLPLAFLVLTYLVLCMPLVLIYAADLSRQAAGRRLVAG